MRPARAAAACVMVSALMSLPASAGVIIQNPGFETGDFSGWTQFGDLSYTTVSPRAAHTGVYGAEFGPENSFGYISQTVDTTPGTLYDLSFWIHNTSGYGFVVFWGDGVEDVIYSEGAAGYSWTKRSFEVLASGFTTTFGFGFYNERSYYYFDDVSLEEAGAVPEPATALLMALGFGAIAAFRGVRKK